MKIERRFMRRVAHRIQPRESGCPVHTKHLLPVLVVWAPSRKKRNQEQHTLNGNMSPSVAGSPPRSVRQRVHIANDDDLEPTLPTSRPSWNVFSHEAKNWQVDMQGMGIVAAPEAHRRHIFTVVPDWHNRPVMIQLSLGALAVYHLRPSDYTPVEEVNILWALEGNSYIRAHNGVLFTYHGFSWRTFEGFYRRPLCGVSRPK